MHSSFRPLRPGDKQISAREMNRAFEQIESQDQQFLPGGFVEVGGIQPHNPQPNPIWIRITGGTNPYSWEEVLPTLVTESESENFTRTGVEGTTTVLPAYEVNSVSSVPAETIVRAQWDMGQGRLLFNSDREVEVVRIRSEVPNPDGYYDGVIQRWNTVTKVWSDVEDIWVLDANG